MRALFLSVVLLVAGIGAACAEGKIVRITTLDWPPFSSMDMPGNGAFIDVCRKALASQGYDFKATFLPWKRAVDVARVDTSYVGLAPIYQDDLTALGAGWFPSVEIARSPLGLAERADKPIAWTTIEDLSKYTIGVVLGYTNTPEFDKAVEDHRLMVDTATTDLLNLRKLANGRLDAVVIDLNVMQYLLSHDPQLQSAKMRIRFNAKSLGTKPLYIGFRDDDAGHAAADAVKKGLTSIDMSSIGTLKQSP